MMSLIARVSSNVSSSTSVSPGKRSYGNPDPWSAIAEKEARSGRPDIGIDRMKASHYYYHEQFIKNFSLQQGLLKIGKLTLRCVSDRCNPLSLLGERHASLNEVSFTRGPSMTEQRTLWSRQSWQTEATRCHPLKRSKATAIHHRVGINCQWNPDHSQTGWIIKLEKDKNDPQWINITEDGEKHSFVCGMLMSVTMEPAAFMGKNYQNCHSIANTKDLTWKQMFDRNTLLVSEQHEISGLETIGWVNHSWQYLSLIVEERNINLRRAKVYIFSDSGLCLVRCTRISQSQLIRCSSMTKSKVYCWD